MTILDLRAYQRTKQEYDSAEDKGELEETGYLRTVREIGDRVEYDVWKERNP